MTKPCPSTKRRCVPFDYKNRDATLVVIDMDGDFDCLTRHRPPSAWDFDGTAGGGVELIAEHLKRVKAETKIAKSHSRYDWLHANAKGWKLSYTTILKSYAPKPWMKRAAVIAFDDETDATLFVLANGGQMLPRDWWRVLDVEFKPFGEHGYEVSLDEMVKHEGEIVDYYYIYVPRVTRPRRNGLTGEVYLALEGQQPFFAAREVWGEKHIAWFERDKI